MSFELHPKEKVINITDTLQNEFQKHIPQNHFQIPLFKIIKGADYTIYLGIPVKTSINKMRMSKIQSNSALSELDTDSATYLYTHYQEQKNYVAELMYTKDKNMIYVLTISKSKQVADSLFQKDLLLNRFK